MLRIAKAATVIAAMGAALFGGAGLAAADADAQGYAIGSPGVLSGNLIQVPIHIPVNVCGNTVSVLGALNPAFGNRCENTSDHHMGDQGGQDNRGEGNWGQDNRGGDDHSGPAQWGNDHHGSDMHGAGMANCDH
ncbi:chaplin [Streptomyces sp. So13.3]|uniref:chaplin n=1 Tax=Streptomyces sp. So13.3 TaxID=2136173 RepID=UPI00110681A2|nr:MULTISPECIES: chaplin [Streptomyces]QNA77053.1 chaplin [Streptomyces sp. So13.3]